MLARLAQRFAWDTDAVLEKYVHGVDWWLVRQILNAKAGDLLPAERRILAVVISGGFWPEHRRYHSGLCASPLCNSCRLEDGTPSHRLHDCSAMAADIVLGVAGGQIPKLPEEARQPGYAPLLEMGLPPRAVPWQPITGQYVEGALTVDPGGNTHSFGDGSGFNQQSVESRVATWAVIRAGPDGKGGTAAVETLRGIVDGWYPTVPRGELTAMNAHIRHAGLTDTYVGDCRHVLDGVERQVPTCLTSSTNINADLWRETRRLLNDHGGHIRVIKTKAHRSRARAETDHIDTLYNWIGNSLADAAAKSLARAAADTLGYDTEVEREREMATKVIRRVAFGAAWSYKRWPAIDGRAARPADHDVDVDEANEEEHIMRRRMDGTYECKLCRKYARTPAGARQLMRQSCGGSVLHRIDESHDLHCTNGITWCNSCGAYATRWPRRLLHGCNGRPRTAAQRTILKKLRAERPPMEAPHFHTAAKEDEGAKGRIGGKLAEDTHNYPRLPAVSRQRGRQTSSPLRDAATMPPSARPSRRTRQHEDDGHGTAIPVHQADAAQAGGSAAAATTNSGTHSGSSESPPQAAGCGRPTTSASWTRWIVLDRLATLSPCDAQPFCGKPTKSRCRACQAALCVQCIRTGKQCRKATVEIAHTCRVRGHSLTVDAERMMAVTSHATPCTGGGAVRRGSGHCINSNAVASVPRATQDLDDGGETRELLGTAAPHSRRSRPYSVPVAKVRGRLQAASCGRSASPSDRASASNHGRQRADLLARLMTMGRDDVARLPSATASRGSVPTMRPGGDNPSVRASIGDPSGLSSARRPAVADDRIGCDHHHHHHHHPRGLVSSLEAAASPASIASESCRYHHHHHDGSSVPSAAAVPCFDARSSCQVSPNTWHEEGPMQQDVVPAAPLDVSVSPLPQVSPVVVVAAGASGVSHLTDLPRHKLECHGDMIAELMVVNPFGSSSAAAAAGSSYDKIHHGVLATFSPLGTADPTSRAFVPEEPYASSLSTLSASSH